MNEYVSFSLKGNGVQKLKMIAPNRVLKIQHFFPNEIALA